MQWMVVSMCAVLAAPGSRAQEQPAPPAYVDEAPLPEGWPRPGPYNEVSEKSVPAYRAAFTTRKGQTIAFWTLFGHIRRRGIPMTAPVEMAMEDEGGALGRASMAFLYQNMGVGAAGPDGARVEVRDVPAAKVLSYTWQGADSKASVARAKAALEAALAGRGLEARQFRLLGYNGPGTPRAKRTWELQVLPAPAGRGRKAG